MLITMTSRPSTTLIRCRGAEKTLCSQHGFGRSTNWTRVFDEMNLSRVPDFETNLYLDIVLLHSSHSYRLWKFRKCGGRFPWDLKTHQTKTFIDCKSKDIFRLLFQSRKNVSVVSTFRFHAIGVWTPKTIGRASRTSNPSGSTGKNLFWEEKLLKGYYYS